QPRAAPGLLALSPDHVEPGPGARRPAGSGPAGAVEVEVVRPGRADLEAPPGRRAGDLQGRGAPGAGRLARHSRVLAAAVCRRRPPLTRVTTHLVQPPQRAGEPPADAVLHVLDLT